MTQITDVFEDVARTGHAVYDDALESGLARIIGDASRSLKASEMKVLERNIDLLMKNVNEMGGRIDGNALNRVRTAMSNLSRREGFSQFARQIDDEILDALVRSNPDKARQLEAARESYRSIRIIEGAIDKGMEGLISPARLANAWGTNANRSASVYGRSGDQQLINLARAGKDIIPDTLPNSGTAARTFFNSPVRSATSGTVIKPISNANLNQPGFVARGAASRRPYLGPSVAQGLGAAPREALPFDYNRDNRNALGR